MIIVFSTCVEVTPTQFFERNLNYELSDVTTLTVVAKRFRCVEVFLMTQRSNEVRHLTYELLDGNILTCRRQTLPIRRSVPHDTELKSVGAQIDIGI